MWGHTGDFPGFHTLALASENGKRAAAIYVNSDGLSPPGALATLQAERMLACRMRFRKLLPFGSADQQPIVSLAIAPDGTLATGSRAGLVQLWNAGSGYTPSHPVLVAAGPVASIAFDRSGQRFATAGSDGTAALWFTTLQREGAALQGDPGEGGNAAFSPDGTTLSVIYDDGRGFQWPATPAAWERHACLVAGRNFTREEWAQFITRGSPASVCK